VTVTQIDKDLEQLTLTVTCELDAPPERAWQLWADPRLLERWWGPPTYPATFVDHDLSPGSTVTYLMTGPEGDQHKGWWKVLAVDPPTSIELEDGFAHDDFTPNVDLPTTTMRVDLHAEPGDRTRMVLTSTWHSLEAMEQMLAMQMDEGLRAALGQIDEVLTAVG